MLRKGNEKEQNTERLTAGHFNDLGQYIEPKDNSKKTSLLQKNKVRIFYLKKNVLTVSTINVNNFLIMFSQEVDKQNAIWRKKEDCKRKKKKQ